MLDNKTILVTGGTGSFGQKFIDTILKKYKLKKVIVFSRDEFKQFEMAKIYPTEKYPIRYFLGDVRDRERLVRAFHGVDYVVHSAALKQVVALEYNPMEAVKTNIMGADNIINAAIECGVKKVIALSTDKAVNPVNLYGATKLAAEKTFVAANAYAGGKVIFGVVRYGNVMGSRGSVIPYFLDLKAQGIKEFPITDKRMTRFWMLLEESVALVLKALEHSVGGEVFIPKIPSMNIIDLAKAIEPKCTFKFFGIRPGEKVHESLFSEDESRNTVLFKDMYVILPSFGLEDNVYAKYHKIPKVKEGYVFRSDTNDQWLTIKDLQDRMKKI
jgi:UDP-N-acetylglucosamine 4,6-dehydratase